MRLERLVDATRAPELEVVFGLAAEELYAWARVERDVERLPGVWATQRLRKVAEGDWRVKGRVVWSDRVGRKVDVPAKYMENPGIDSQLHRVGPTIERLRAFVLEAPASEPAFRNARTLLFAIDRFRFAARSNRGDYAQWPEQERLGPTSDATAALRQRRREGLVAAPDLSDDERQFLRLRGPGVSERAALRQAYGARR